MKTTSTNSFDGWNVIGGGMPMGDMIPETPGTIPETPPTPTTPPVPGPTQPGVPETPPSPPVPGPEIPDLPSTPKPTIPDIRDNQSTVLTTFTTAAPGVVPSNGPKPEKKVGETKYEGLPEAAKAVPGSEEGMENKPDTGDSARPYDVNAKDTAENQPGERPEEAKEAQKFPREMADESSIAAQDMISGTDRSDQKSTEGLDRKYNDPEASREMAS